MSEHELSGLHGARHGAFRPQPVILAAAVAALATSVAVADPPVSGPYTRPYHVGKVVDMVTFNVEQKGGAILPLNLLPRDYAAGTPNPKHNHEKAKAVDKTQTMDVTSPMGTEPPSGCTHCEWLVFSDCPERLEPRYFTEAMGAVLFWVNLPILQSRGWRADLRVVMNHELAQGMQDTRFLILFENRVSTGEIRLYEGKKGMAIAEDDPVAAGKQTSFTHLTSTSSNALLATLQELGGGTTYHSIVASVDSDHPEGWVHQKEVMSGIWDFTAVFDPIGGPSNGVLRVYVVAVPVLYSLIPVNNYLNKPMVPKQSDWKGDHMDQNSHVRGTFRHSRREISLGTVAPTPDEPWYFAFGRKPVPDADEPPAFPEEYEKSITDGSTYVLGNYGVSHKVSMQVPANNDPMLVVMAPRAGAFTAGMAWAGNGVFWIPGDYQRQYIEDGACPADPSPPLRVKEVSNIKADQCTGVGSTDWREGVVVGTIPTSPQARTYILEFIPANGITTPENMVVVNMGQEPIGVASSSTQQGRVVPFQVTGTILPAELRPYQVALALSTLMDIGGALMDLQIALSWLGSELGLSITAPDGRVISATSLPPGVTRSRQGTTEVFVVADPPAGTWTLNVAAVDVPEGGEPYTLTMSVPEQPQSNCTLAVTPATTLVLPGGSVQLAATGGSGPFSWMVTSNNSGGAVSPTGLYTPGTATNVTDVVAAFDQGGCLPGYATMRVVAAMPYPGGDANGDGTVNVSDVFHLINFLFAGGAAPVGPADVNGSGAVGVDDVFYLINYLFAGGAAPV